MNTQSHPTANSQHEVDIHELHLISDEKCTVRVCTPPNAHEPTGEYILSLAGGSAGPEQLVFQLLNGGGIESIRLDERINLCRRRSKFEPPCRLNIEPGVEADFERVGCG